MLCDGGCVDGAGENGYGSDDSLGHGAFYLHYLETLSWKLLMSYVHLSSLDVQLHLILHNSVFVVGGLSVVVMWIECKVFLPHEGIHLYDKPAICIQVVC